jgi:hypothetical protein
MATSRKPSKRSPAKPQRKPAKAASRAGKKPVKAAPRRAPAKPKAQKATRVEASAMPTHAASQAAARRAVARPTKAHHENQTERAAEHDHQDPRLAGIPGVSHEGRKVQPENYGQFKNKAVARLDKPVNWFRRAARPKP